MPFATARQEMFMKIRMPKIWKDWVKKYGHHPKFKAFEKAAAKRAAKTRKKKKKR